jgi:DTW domain-containing protein YfiP
MTVQEACPRCEKPLELCICSGIDAIDNKIGVLILRHPQEQDKILGTALLTRLQLKNATLKTGLSWPNLAKVLGRTADPKRWGILYLGTAKTAVSLPKQVLTVLSQKGNVLPDQEELLEALEGIILLDGNWQQAKALWWRNAWMLKCRRLVLQPLKPSLYGNLRKEPRKESVATIEAAAYAIAELEGDAALADKIMAPFKMLLNKAKTAKKANETD